MQTVQVDCHFHRAQRLAKVLATVVTEICAGTCNDSVRKKHCRDAELKAVRLRDYVFQILKTGIQLRLHECLRAVVDILGAVQPRGNHRIWVECHLGKD